MEAQSTIKELQRIERIAYGKIPVSEESSIFNLFAERRELCLKALKTITDADRQHIMNYLEHIEDNIKQYLCL